MRSGWGWRLIRESLCPLAEFDRQLATILQLSNIAQTQQDNIDRFEIVMSGEGKGKKKAHKCLLCKREVIGRGDFNKHYRTHTNHRPYQCRAKKASPTIAVPASPLTNQPASQPPHRSLIDRRLNGEGGWPTGLCCVALRCVVLCAFLITLAPCSTPPCTKTRRQDGIPDAVMIYHFIDSCRSVYIPPSLPRSLAPSLFRAATSGSVTRRPGYGTSGCTRMSGFRASTANSSTPERTTATGMSSSARATRGRTSAARAATTGPFPVNLLWLRRKFGL